MTCRIVYVVLLLFLVLFTHVCVFPFIFTLWFSFEFSSVLSIPPVLFSSLLLLPLSLVFSQFCHLSSNSVVFVCLRGLLKHGPNACDFKKRRSEACNVHVRGNSLDVCNATTKERRRQQEQTDITLLRRKKSKRCQKTS